jgi:hypothetical protein
MPNKLAMKVLVVEGAWCCTQISWIFPAQTGRSAVCARGLHGGRTLHLDEWADRHPCVASCAQQVAD